jgi:hypothetical protein
MLVPLMACLSWDSAWKAVKWDVLVTIAAAFGLSSQWPWRRQVVSLSVAFADASASD